MTSSLTPHAIYAVIVFGVLQVMCVPTVLSYVLSVVWLCRCD